jgi:hypothetical protein
VKLDVDCIFEIGIFLAHCNTKLIFLEPVVGLLEEIILLSPAGALVRFGLEIGLHFLTVLGN